MSYIRKVSAGGSWRRMLLMCSFLHISHHVASSSRCYRFLVSNLCRSQTLTSGTLIAIATSFFLLQQQAKSVVIPFQMIEEEKEKSLAYASVIYCLVISLAR